MNDSLMCDITALLIFFTLLISNISKHRIKGRTNNLYLALLIISCVTIVLRITELPEGRVTLCKIAPDYTLENTLCIPANIKENLSLENYCRTQITVSLNEESLLDLLKASFGNHVIVSYGDVYQDFLPLLSLLRR